MISQKMDVLMQILVSFGVVSFHRKELCYGFVLTNKERDKNSTCLTRQGLVEQYKIMCISNIKQHAQHTQVGCVIRTQNWAIRMNFDV